MEQCLRIAFWMVVLTGCLQAKPVTPGPDTTKACWSYKFKNLSVDLLRDDNPVVCLHTNATFPSLNGMDMKADCVQVLACCIEGLEDAESKCTQKWDRIRDIVYDLKKGGTKPFARCERPKTSNFADFVDTIETFVQSVNTRTTSRK